MLGKYLKILREKMSIEGESEKFSLRAVSERWGKANSYLSDIENGLIKNPKHEAIIDLLVKGYDIPHSRAKDMIAQWMTEEALSKASDPSKVINSIVAGNNSIVITGDGNNISK